MAVDKSKDTKILNTLHGTGEGNKLAHADEVFIDGYTDDSSVGTTLANTDNVELAIKKLNNKINTSSGSIGNYTVNGKKISTNPVLKGTDINIGNYSTAEENDADQPITNADSVDKVTSKLGYQIQDLNTNKQHAIAPSDDIYYNTDDTKLYLSDRSVDATKYISRGYKILRPNLQQVNDIPAGALPVDVLEDSATGRTSTKAPANKALTIHFDLNGIAYATVPDDTNKYISWDAYNGIQASTAYMGSDNTLKVGKYYTSTKLYTVEIVGTVVESDMPKKTVNLLIQDMINEPDTTYVIKYDFDCNGATINIPDNCYLQFENGTITNGVIVQNKYNEPYNISSVSKPILKSDYPDTSKLQKIDSGSLFYNTDTEELNYFDGTVFKSLNGNNYIDYTKYLPQFIIDQNDDFSQMPIEAKDEQGFVFVNIDRSIPNIGSGLKNYLYFNLTLPNDQVINTASNTLYKPFEESDYRNTSVTTYRRFTWLELESTKGTYTFDFIDEWLKSAIQYKSKVIIGLPINCYNSSLNGIEYTTEDDGSKRYYFIPKYLFDELQASDHPCLQSEEYQKQWCPDYESDIFIERFNSLLEAFNTWLNGNVSGTTIQRRKLIYAVEERFIGHWGEGIIKTLKAGKLIQYHNKYLELFNDKIVCLPLLPITICSEGWQYSTLGKDNADNLKRFMYQALKTKTSVAGVGVFKDSFTCNAEGQVPTSRSTAYYLLDENNNKISAYKFLRDNIYGKRFVEGEVDFIQRLWNSVPDQISFCKDLMDMKFSCLRYGNNTIYYLGSYYNQAYRNRSDYNLKYFSRVVNLIGYRFVYVVSNLNMTDTQYNIQIVFSNIGLSNPFNLPYDLWVYAIDKQNNILISQKIDNFSFDNIKREENYSAGSYPTSAIYPVNITLQKTQITVDSDIYIAGVDRDGILYNLNFSNYGRTRLSNQINGLYKVATVKNGVISSLGQNKEYPNTNLNTDGTLKYKVTII